MKKDKPTVSKVKDWKLFPEGQEQNKDATLKIAIQHSTRSSSQNQTKKKKGILNKKRSNTLCLQMTTYMYNPRDPQKTY